MAERHQKPMQKPQPASRSKPLLNSIDKRSAYLSSLELGIVVFLLLATVAINLRMIRYGLNGLGDSRWHLTWLQHFSKQFFEGIWYPRWLAGTNLGYGSPTFVFYPPLVYYLGVGLKALGLTFEQTVNTLFSGAIFLSGVSFYQFGKPHWGRFAALVGALAYILSPGIAYLINGGALAWLYSFIWPPLLLLLTHRAVNSASACIWLSLVWALAALTHLPSFLIFAVGWTIYTLALLWPQPWRMKLRILLCAPLGWGLAALFLVPAVLEQRYINIDYMLDSQAGFRTSLANWVELAKGGMGDIIVRQWLACIAFSAIAFAGFVRRPAQRRITMILLVTVAGLVFLMSDVSWPLWALNPVLQKIESAVRLAQLQYLAGAALCALAVRSLHNYPRPFNRFSQLLLLTVIGAILLSNFSFGYQLMRKSPTLHSGGNGVVVNQPWLEQIVNDPDSDRLIDVPEYRPRLPSQLASDAADKANYIKETYTLEGFPEVKATVSGQLPTPQPNQPKIELAQGSGETTVIDWSSYHRRLTLSALTPVTALLKIYTYPGWQIYANGEKIATQTAFDGRIQFTVAPGNYEIDAFYKKTFSFKLGLAISAVSSLVWLALSYHWVRLSHPLLIRSESSGY